MSEKILPLLRDIQQPAYISWWPLAPGWWVLLVFLLTAAWICWKMIWPRLQLRWRRQYWQQRLAKLETLAQKPRKCHHALMLTSALLHQLAHQYYPDRNPAELTNQAWLQFLNETSPDGVQFGDTIGEALIIGPYRKEIKLTDTDCKTLFSRVTSWIIKHV